MVGTLRKASWALLFIVVVRSVPAASASDRFVATTGIDGANDCSVSTAPCRTLGHAITAATAGDEIKVGHGVYVETVTIAGPPTVTVSGGWSDGFTSRDLDEHATTFSRGSLGVTPAGDDSITVHLDGLRFSKNLVGGEGQGGGTTHLIVSDSRFSGVGTLGGSQAAGSGTTVLDVTHCLFKGTRWHPCVNCAGAIGAGAAAGTVNVSVQGSTFTHDLGGINFQTFLGGTGSLSVDACVFDHVKSKGIGGIFVLAGGPGGTSVTVTNSVLTHDGPAAIEFLDYESAPPAVLTLVADTMVRNVRGVSVAPMPSANADVALTDTIVWNSRGNDLELGGTLVASLDHDDIGTIAGAVNDLGGNVSIDPQLVKNGFALADTSPMIDAGTCTGAPSTDIQGDPRPSGAGCDIGADEHL